MMSKTSNITLVQSVKKGGITVLIFLVLQNGVSFLSQLIMARLIAPDAFGLIAMALLIGMIFQTLFNSQGDKFIIQSKENSKRILNVIISFELIFSIFFIIVISFSAPYITRLFGREDLTFLIQLLALSYLATPFQKIRSFFEKDLLMMKSKLSLFLAQVIGGGIGVIMALNNFGVYALVVWRISTPIIDAIVLLCMIKFDIKFSLSKKIMVDVYKFTWPLIISSGLIYFIYNIDYYIVGHFEDYEALGYYWLAFQVSHYFLSAKTAINSVLFPAFSKINLLKDKISLFNKVIRVTSVIYTIPAIVFLLFGDDIVTLLYGEKWIKSVVPLQIFFIIVAVKAIGSNVGPFFYSFGKTKQDLSIGLVNAITLPVIVSFGVYFFGINGAAMGVLISAGLNALYGFVRYVVPITKKSITYYYGKTILLFFLILLLLLIKRFSIETSNLFIDVGSFLLILLIYLSIFKSDLQLLHGLIVKHFKLKNV